MQSADKVIETIRRRPLNTPIEVKPQLRGKEQAFGRPLLDVAMAPKAVLRTTGFGLPLPTRSGHSRGLLDHLVGAREDRWRDRQTERLGGLQIDDELEFGWLLDGQVGRLGTFENFVDIRSSAPEEVVQIGS